jgi:pimeloyl-ACP methyl ester carboxylesterase
MRALAMLHPPASTAVTGHLRMETMTNCTYYPYRSEAARDICLQYFLAKAIREWPIASEEYTVPTAYGETFVRVSGPPGAPPLVLLHGAGATSLMWTPNIQALSAGCRTFAVDQIGEFGRSLCTRPPRSLDDMMTWLNQLFDGLDLKGPVNLAGMSYGGALAAQYALRSPQRLSRLVLIAPGSTVLRLRAAFWMHVLVLAIGRRRGLAPFLRWVFPDMAQKDGSWINSIAEELTLNMRSIQRHHPPIPPVLTDAEWGSLRVRTLFLVGEHEVIYSPAKAVARLKTVAPAIRREIVPGGGHDLTFASAGTVNQRILEFLRNEPAP